MRGILKELNPRCIVESGDEGEIEGLNAEVQSGVGA